jgi:hypothetical protein
MENLIYVAVVILYFIYQASQARSRKRKAEEAKQRQQGMPAENTQPKPLMEQGREIQDRMKEIFREMEMKTNPYSQPHKTEAPSRKHTSAKPLVLQKPFLQPAKKKAPEPFLTVDMTEEEVLPEGTPSV